MLTGLGWTQLGLLVAWYAVPQLATVPWWVIWAPVLLQLAHVTIDVLDKWVKTR